MNRDWRRLSFVVFGLLSAAGLMGCPAPVVECLDGTEPVCDAGGLPPDFCNSREEALADPTNCQLTVNDATGMVVKDQVYISRLGDGGVDKDWYFAHTPSTVNARSLLHVSAGYSVSQTAVNFSVNVLRTGEDGGLVSVASGIDTHGTAAPKPVDIVIPFSYADTDLYFLVGDQSSGTVSHVDNVATYSMLVQIIDNPDQNEPNDTTPTAIPLTAGADSIQTGMQSGYLATANDVDLYTFQVSGASRQIIYVHLTGPTPFPTNPPPYTLSYTLTDPMGKPISEGVMQNRFLPFELATARLATGPGTYTLRVQGYRDSTTVGDIGGDLKVKYNVAVQVMPDKDLLEGSTGNDTFATAASVSLTPNAPPKTITGKLSYVADEEWFVANLPARATPSVLRYKLTTLKTGGRFQPISNAPSRQLRFSTTVTNGSTSQDRQVACLKSATDCPKGFDGPAMTGGNGPQALVASICQSNDPPLCLYAERDEDLLFTDLKNLVGAIPIPANKAMPVYMMYRDQGAGKVKYADDRDWTLELSLVDDPDEAARAGGPTQVAINGSTPPQTGQLTYGYGMIFDPPLDITKSGAGIRALQDYDAQQDRDLYQFNTPPAVGDQSWEIAWEIQHNDAGIIPGDLAFDLTFCGTGAFGDGGLCAGSANKGYLADLGQSVSPWYAPPDLAHATMLFQRQETATSTIVTARPIACNCLSAPRVAAGQFFVNVVAYNRMSNDPISYTITQRMTPYPSSYIGDGGVSMMCPVTDAGCGFIPNK